LKPTLQVFDRVDVNKNNSIESIEAEVAILSLYNIVNKRVPGKDPGAKAPPPFFARRHTVPNKIKQKRPRPPLSLPPHARNKQQNRVTHTRTHTAGWQDPPTRARIMEALKQCDKDGTGALDKAEFFVFAKELLRSGPVRVVVIQGASRFCWGVARPF